MNLSEINFDGYDVQFADDIGDSFLIRFENRGATIFAICNGCWDALARLEFVGDGFVAHGVPPDFAPYLVEAIDSVLEELGLPVRSFVESTPEVVHRAALASTRPAGALRMVS